MVDPWKYPTERSLSLGMPADLYSHTSGRSVCNNRYCACVKQVCNLDHEKKESHRSSGFSLTSSGVLPAAWLEWGSAGFTVMALGCRARGRHKPSKTLRLLTYLSADGSSQQHRALGQAEPHFSAHMCSCNEHNSRPGWLLYCSLQKQPMQELKQLDQKQQVELKHLKAMPIQDR